MARKLSSTVVIVILVISVVPNVNSANENTETLGNLVDFSRLFGLNYGDPDPDVQDSYDFIVVGAGPAGSVVANRLTENPSITVLLLEIGKAEIPFLQQVPSLFPAQAATDYNFGYLTERQKRACLGLIDQRCAWHQGRGLGGSTIINDMLYTRGNRRDFDHWNATGNQGWSYEEVLPYFLKSERANIRDFEKNGFHSDRGYLPVEDATYRSPLVDALVESAQLLGLSYIDQNGPEQYGVSYAQFTMRSGKRMSAGSAFLQPIRERTNLHILTKAWATKVIFSKTTNTAKGVSYTRGKKNYTVRAKREVILSGGTFGSAKLLMLSGVGPRNHLRELGINVIKHLPVGETLYDHPAAIGPVFIASNLNDEFRNTENLLNFNTILEYINGGGPLSSAYAEGLAFFKTPTSFNRDPAWPDVELAQLLGNPGDDPTPVSRMFFRINDEIMENYFKPLRNRRAFMYLSYVLNSTTKGSLRLKSTNPYDHPVFNYQYFEDNRDLEAIVHAIKGAIEITKQKPFRELGVEIYRANVPGCQQFQFDTDDYWRCHAMTLTYAGYHFVGTCKMGPASDPTAVVDHRLRVHGTRKLRVVDTGIIPAAPSGHTSAYAYMIGEKAADMIKQDNLI